MKPRIILALALCLSPALPQVPAELQQELRRLQAQFQEMTKPDVPISVRKEYAERILKLRELLEQVASKPVLVLTSVSLSGGGLNGRTAVTRFSEKQQGEWKLKPFVPGAFFSEKHTETAWMLESTLALPKEIALGQDFAIGVCGAATLFNRGGEPPRAADRLQHETLVSVSPGSNYARSYQQFSLPATRGEESRQAQVSEIRFRFDAASSRPPSSYVYRAEARQSGADQDQSRLTGRNGNLGPPSSSPPQGLVFTFGTRVQQGPLGTDTTIEAPPAAIAVRLEHALVYGLTTPDSGMITLHESAFREWDVVYRVLKAGERAPALNPPPPSSACQAGSIGGSAAPVSAIPPQPSAGPASSRVVIADLRGRRADEAARTLRDAGLQVRPRIGPAAPSPETQNTVASLSPGPGTTVDPGTVVEVVVHGAFSRSAVGASVPRLDGLLAAEAKVALERAGLRIRPEIGPAAANVADANRVQSQAPAPGTSLEPGAEVRVVLFGAPQVARTRTPPRILPRPPSRTFSCPAPAEQWQSVNAQATSTPAFSEGMEFNCYYRHPQRTPQRVSIQYTERGYHSVRESCGDDAKGGHYVFEYIGVDSRGMSDAQSVQASTPFFGMSAANDERYRNIMNVVRPALIAQVTPYAQPCGAPPAPVVDCADNALCALRCPAILGTAAARATVSPRSIWRSSGHIVLTSCQYNIPGTGYLALYVEVDPDDTMAVERRIVLGKCGTGALVTRTESNFGGVRRDRVEIASARQRVSIRASSVPGAISSAVGEAATDLFRQLEPRSFLPCVP